MERRFNRGVPLGVDAATGEPLTLGLARLTEHVDIVGPTGCGKTRSTIFPWFTHLALVPQATVIVMSPKGDLCPMARDWAIGHGLTNRLQVFDPQETPLVGFNPLRRNGWPASRHAKVARSAVRASHGQRSFDETPQLARLLFLSLAVALEQQLTFVEAVRLLRPGISPFRRDMLRAVQDDFLRESLEWFDDLKKNRQEELAASTLGRLESFIADPLIRAILTEQDRCLDLGDVVKHHKILLINLELFKPLVPDDVRTLGRLLLNNILAHVFARPKAERSPVFLLIDEVQQFATEDLADALTLGRELGLYTVVAHQYPSQLKLNKDDSHLFEAVLHCCRTKVVFGGVHVDELEGIVRELMIDQFNPYFVKDERTTLELEPVESTREVVSSGHSFGGSVGVNQGRSSARSRGRSHGVSHQVGRSESHGTALSSAHASGVTTALMAGETILPNGETLSVLNDGSGTSEADVSGETLTDTYGTSESHGTQDSTSATESEGSQTALGMSVNGSMSKSRSRVPFYEYRKQRIVSSRTFLTLDEFLTLCLQKIKAQARGHFVIKVPDQKALFVRAPFVRVPWITNAIRSRALARIYQSLGSDVKAVPREIPPADDCRPPYQLLSPVLESTEPQPLLPGEASHRTSDPDTDPWE